MPTDVQHGLSNKQSNHAKQYTNTRTIFQDFIKQNSIPTGRSTGIKYRLDSRFKRLQYNITRAKEKPEQSVHGAFNMYAECLQQKGIHTNNNVISSGLPCKKISGMTAHRWFKEDFENTVLCPNPTDYCGTCYSFKEQLKSLASKLTLAKVR
jgi:hypothetical protein